ncbi:VanZ family protein [Bacillus salipaludis]|uniref:VanZ family protein n=1 Tax=Bacillus salipaludis TaxID=2547811 RepID=A0A4R5VQ48_9BACI|nr:VanZ family protein [Bacillus salipaludis]MDQ6595916.1 VanZ family protein [Bacillus salipaludis]TDK59754.1 VanZ family protein [Bacillus salipaludis]
MNQQRTPKIVDPQKDNQPIKIFAILLWGLFLLINTWTNNLELMIHSGSVEFQWNSSPDFISFFNFNDIALIHPYFVVIKLGHFIGFAIMDLLIFNLLKSHKSSITISVAFAFFTEFFQLYWGRDGRLYDLGIDTLGILTIYITIKTLNKEDQKK